MKYYSDALEVRNELGLKSSGLMNTIGDVNYHLGNYEASLEFHRKALIIRQEDGDILDIASSNNNIGMVYESLGDIPNALDYYGRSLALFKSVGNKLGQARLLGNIGIIYKNQGNHSLAIDYYTKSLKIWEEIGTDKRGISITLNNIGNIYLIQKDYLKAIEYHDRSLQLKRDLKNQKSIAASLSNIGSTYLLLKEYGKARAYLEESLIIREKIGDKNGVATSLLSLGTLYSQTGDKSAGLAAMRRSYDMYSQIGEKPGQASSLTGIASILLDQGDFNSALVNAKKGLEIAYEVDYINVIKDASEILWKAFRALNRPDSALLMHELYIQMRDSILSEENQKEVMRQQFQYDYEKKELAIQKEMELSALKFEYEKKQAAARSEQEKEQLRYEEELKRTQIEADYAQKQAAMEAEQRRKEAIAKAEQEKKDAIAAEQLKRKNQQRNAFIGGFALTLGLAGVSYRSYRRKKRDNVIITRQKEEVEHKNTEILASITYARRLQEAVLPPPKVVKEFFNDSFLLYLPRDIVSGDFYWMESTSPTPPEEGLRTPISELADRTAPHPPQGGRGVSYFAVGDCTGHGVPGAMLSVMGLNGLNRALNELRLTEPKDLLTQLTKDLHDAFERNETTVRDGMDLALCALNTDTMTLTFCGANNPLWIARNGEMLQFKPNKRPVGFYDMDRPFGQETIQLQPGDVIYIHSDGYQDQLGGPEGKKFMTKKYRELLLSMAHLPMAQQRERLLAEHTEWRGTCGQTDDICVMGVRV